MIRKGGDDSSGWPLCTLTWTEQLEREMGRGIEVCREGGAQLKAMSSLMLVLLLLAGAGQALCQEATRASITYEKTMMGRSVFTCRGEKLTRGTLESLLREEPKAAGELAAANWRVTASNGLGVAGGALIAWPVAGAIGGAEDLNWTLAYAGGGCVLVALVLAASADGRYRNAADAYNGEVQHGLLPFATPVQLCMRPNGVMLSVRF